MGPLTKSIELPGYEKVRQGPHTILIRPEWKDALLQDLTEDFVRVTPSERKLFTHGRTAHFSYLPRGAPARVFVRQARRGGLLGAVLGGLYLDLKRPLLELRAAALARSKGVGTPEPLAVRLTAAGPFHRFTMLTREVEDAKDLLTISAAATPSEKRLLLRQVSAEMRKLHEAGIYHSDLTLKNILMGRDGIFIIDLDKAHIATGREEARDVTNLSRLNRSVVKLFGKRGPVTRTDKLRFLRCYLGGSERLAEFSRLCAQGLWAHRLWWSLSGRS
jgi:hypothetical protein